MLYNLGFSQIQEKPENFSKIKYTYHTSSNYYINEKGVYADTLLFQIDFPGKKYGKTQSIIDSTYIVGFIPKYSFNAEEKVQLNRKISLYYNSREVIHDLTTNKSEITITKPNVNLIPETIQNFIGPIPQLFNPTSTSTITYLNDTKYLVENTVEKTVDSYKNNVISWLDEKKEMGLFDYNLNQFTFKNLVIIDKNLDAAIVPTIRFANCEYGIMQIIAIPFTVTLVKVEYF